MTIVLNDIPPSVADYIRQNVIIDVTNPHTGNSSVLQPNDDATFDVTLTNKGTVGLINVQYHLTVDEPTIAQFLSLGSALTPSRPDFGEDTFSGDDTQTPTLLISPVDLSGLAILQPGAPITFRNLRIHLRKKGSTGIKVHIHADIDQSTLFPSTQRGNATKVDIEVK
jgi:uncharacterized repeat protein (TIGR01451 family)